MNAREWLELLLPTSGVLFTATKPSPTGAWHNTAHTSLVTVVREANRLSFAGQPAFIALASYKEARYFDAEFKNTDGTVGKFRSRTQANAIALKSLFLDLDVESGNANKFESPEAALAALGRFAVKVGLPAPLTVRSGGGVHVYWPLSQAVDADEWREVAEVLKFITLHEGFLADRVVTSDPARVLRILGTFNERRGAMVALVSEGAGAHPFELLKTIILNYADANGISGPPSKKLSASKIAGTQANILDDNLGTTNEPLNFDRIAFSCHQLGNLAGTHGASAGEQVWRAALGVIKFCENPSRAAAAVSDAHPEYDESLTLEKIARWQTGPSTCAHFHQIEPATCEGCPHWTALTSPAELGRVVKQAAAPTVLIELATGEKEVVALPDPPVGYIRRKSDGWIVQEAESKGGTMIYNVICPMDLYPMRILRQSGKDAIISERTIWRADVPGVGEHDMDLPQGLLADTKRLHGILNEQGVVLTTEQSKTTQHYMSAYLQTLAAASAREKVYGHLGWHDDRTAFVMGDYVIERDGKTHPHAASSSIKSVIDQDGLRPAGTFAAWLAAMEFYNQPGYEGARWTLYISLGVVLAHMNQTGIQGGMISLNGASGRGKTTAMRAGASLWGNPAKLIINGNKSGTTLNALHETMGVYHSLPIFLDEVTERDADERRELVLDATQGRGKVRMRDGHNLSERQVRWESPTISTENTDPLQLLMSTGNDVSAHLNRLLSIEFGLLDTSAAAKIKADAFIRAFNQNYGHVGPRFMTAVMSNYDLIRIKYQKNADMIDTLIGSKDASGERYWSQYMALGYTAASMAIHLGLFPKFNLKTDLLWAAANLTKQRTQISEFQPTAPELLAEFLESHINHILPIDAQHSPNLDGTIGRLQGALLIRHEIDNDLMYITKKALQNYCDHSKMTFASFETALKKAGIILDHNHQKVLGAGTAYAKGQVRTWKIDTTKLAPSTIAVVTSGTASAPSVSASVTPIRKKA